MTIMLVGQAGKTVPFIGTRAASRPPTLLESSNDDRRTSESGDGGQDDFSDENPGDTCL